VELYQPINFKVTIEIIEIDEIFYLPDANFIQATSGIPFKPVMTKFAPVKSQYQKNNQYC
jgi:hypothetical protein